MSLKRKYATQVKELPIKKRKTVRSNYATRNVHRGMKVEKKVNDIATATYQVNTTGVFTLLANPALGSDFNNRVGRKIRLRSLYIRGFVATQNSLDAGFAGTQSQQMRMILLLDLQPNGAVPATADLLVTANTQSHLNLNNRDRFVILKDETYVFDPYFASNTATQSFASMSNQIKDIKCYKKLNSEMVFNGTNGGTIADINSGALYMFWIGSDASGANDGNAIVSTRVRYDDM